MDSLQFVSLAVCKDAHRYNISGVYRDKKHLVGTDGHRLHFSNGLPEVEQGYFLDSRDAQFPDWTRAFPLDAPTHSLDCKIGKEELQLMKAFLGYVKATNKSDKTVVLSVTDGKINLELKNQKGTGKISVGTVVTEGQIPELGINLSFLLDALSSALNITAAFFTLNYFGEGAPVKIDIPNLGSAVIMPIRLK